MGGRKVSLPLVLFYLVGQPLKMLRIPGGGGGGVSNKYGTCNLKLYTDSETIFHFTDMGAAYKRLKFLVLG